MPCTCHSGAAAGATDAFQCTVEQFMTSPPFHDEWGVSRAGAKNRQWYHLQRVAKYESRGFTCVPASTRLFLSTAPPLS
jgi:hypothetical protein